MWSLARYAPKKGGSARSCRDGAPPGETLLLAEIAKLSMSDGRAEAPALTIRGRKIVDRCMSLGTIK